jgi:hypothetical protein
MIRFPEFPRKISIADAIRQIPGTFVAGGAGQHNRRQNEQEEIWGRKIQKVCHQAYRLRRHGGTPKGNFAKQMRRESHFARVEGVAQYG